MEGNLLIMQVILQFAVTSMRNTMHGMQKEAGPCGSCFFFLRFLGYKRMRTQPPGAGSLPIKRIPADKLPQDGNGWNFILHIRLLKII